MSQLLNEKIASGIGGLFEAYTKRIHETAVKFAPFKKGNLERSIRRRTKVYKRDWWKNIYEIYVLRASKAGKYAHVIHDLRYVRWWKRGPGTVKKGRNAKEKFIDRAVDKWEKKLSDSVRFAVDKAVFDYATTLSRNAQAAVRVR